MIKLPHKEYFEGILQLRSPSTKVIDFVLETTGQEGKAVITKKKKVRNGYDFYFSSQKYLRALGKKLKQRFKGVLKTSRSLHTVNKTGKKLYRVTVMFRPLKINIGDKIKIRGNLLQITAINNFVLLKDVKSGKRVRYSFEIIEEITR